MFGLFKPKKSYELQTSALHDKIIERALKPVFYKKYGVPDTLDGRFEMFALHLFLLLHRLADDPEYATFAQELYDTSFRFIDKGLREAGIGDMGVPKHMRRMLKGFNGRVEAYSVGVTKGARVKALDDAIIRNVYGTVEKPSADKVKQMRSYIKANVKTLAQQPLEALSNGRVKFIPLSKV